MSEQETYNGWTNRETWAVALHINNDQGWQESVREALREGDYSYGSDGPMSLEGAREAYEGEYWNPAQIAGDIIRENVEGLLNPGEYRDNFGEPQPQELAQAAHEVGSLWRVNWTELGASFLEDLED